MNIEDFSFRVHRIIGMIHLENSLMINQDRYKIQIVENFVDKMLRGMLEIATHEDQVHDYPEDWWQSCKARWFPDWLKRKSPVRYSRIWAVHKYPELNIPNELVGREFIHFKVVKDSELANYVDKNDTIKYEKQG